MSVMLPPRSAGAARRPAPGLGGVIVGLPTSTAFSRSVFLVGGVEPVGEPSLYLSEFNHLNKHTCYHWPILLMRFISDHNTMGRPVLNKDLYPVLHALLFWLLARWKAEVSTLKSQILKLRIFSFFFLSLFKWTVQPQ